MLVLRRDTVTDNAILELNLRAAADRSVRLGNNAIIDIGKCTGFQVVNGSLNKLSFCCAGLHLKDQFFIILICDFVRADKLRRILIIHGIAGINIKAQRVDLIIV